MKQIIKLFILILFLNNLVFAQGGLVKVQKWKAPISSTGCDATNVYLDYNPETLAGIDDSCPPTVFDDIQSFDLGNSSCDRYAQGGGVRLKLNQLGTHNALRFTNGAFGFFTTPLVGTMFTNTQVAQGVTMFYVIKSNNNSNTGQLITNSGGSGNNAEWLVENGKIIFRQFSAPTTILFTSTGSLSTSSYKIVATYWDETNDVAKVYMNGALDSSGATVTPFPINEGYGKLGSNVTNGADPLNADIVRIRAYCGGELNNTVRDAEFNFLNGIYGVY
jgi:hypothetical protein